MNSGPIVLEGRNSDLAVPSYFRIEDEGAFAKALELVGEGGTAPDHDGGAELLGGSQRDLPETGPPPAVDFEQCMLVGIFVGKIFNTINLRVVDISEDQDDVVVRFEKASFQSGPRPSLTSPYMFVALEKKKNRNVILLENTQNVMGEDPIWTTRARLGVEGSSSKPAVGFREPSEAD